MERALNVGLALAIGSFGVPLWLLLAAGVRLSDGGPVLFSQVRCGLGGRRFRLYKFRTLPVAAAASGDTAWRVEARRPFLAWLRRTGLDETPQLWNVLRGEMNLVGPRPERPHFVDRFRRSVPGYSRRMEVRPGITGWAQVHGLRGDTSIERRVGYDLEYLDRRSLALDLRILWRTLVGLLQSAVAGRQESAESPCPSTHP